MDMPPCCDATLVEMRRRDSSLALLRELDPRECPFLGSTQLLGKKRLRKGFSVTGMNLKRSPKGRLKRRHRQDRNIIRRRRHGRRQKENILR